MFKNAKIRTKILIGFGIILFLMFVTTISSYYNLNHIETAENIIIDDLVPINNIIKEINIEVINEETGVRGYIASNGDEKYLDSYSASKNNIDKKIKELQKYYGASQELKIIIDNEEIPNIGVINKYFASQIELIKSGKIETARDRLSVGKGNMDAFKHVQDKVNNEVSKLLDEAVKSSQRANFQSKAVLTSTFIISTIIGIFIAMFYSYMMAGQLKKSIESLEEIAIGNLVIEPIKVDSKDEFGQLGDAINHMQNSLKEIITTITSETNSVNDALNISNENILDLTIKLEDISATAEQLSAGMQETSALTEEINSSSIDLKKVVNSIANKAQEGAVSAEEISKKAMNLKNSSITLETDANKTQMDIKKVMDEALEKVKEVEKIKILANSIEEISSQTNLIALNASIESARAGEQGKGFAVVAEEIRKLAENSSDTVKEIQETINEVFVAVENLSNASKITLDYIETKVVKSYKESVLVGENYNKDADYVNGLVADLSSTSEELLASISTVAEAIEEISKANAEGAQGTNDIADRVLKIKDRTNVVKLEAGYVSESAENLKKIVLKFKV
ncbi:methyl-accepting chemotaxis protein [Clostridium sp. PL3]|uniref:Methyl-accepting chemotaxis protein n=1 Tax=Clostridium thailandense TaxID=2794346 RepID=A0A949X3Q0_9CLOT|nr:methyl-accepting chemotaxis protein [Clostridium thailandense]MBV7272733.1 methyl-accepting chemotaxis protein [Clostridium thailandense]